MSHSDRMTRTGRAYVDSDSLGSYTIRTDGDVVTGTGGRAALEDALARHGLEPRAWRCDWAGYDETREMPAAVGGTFLGLVQVSRDSCEVWALNA